MTILTKPPKSRHLRIADNFGQTCGCPIRFDCITKTVHSQLHNRFGNIVRQCCANAKYSTRECVEIVGIPTSVPDNELEETLCKFVNNVGVKINDRDIESCHCVGSHGRMIVKVSHKFKKI